MSYTNGLDKPTDYFNTVLYAGDDTAIGSGGQAITGVGFQPDWVWIKRRNVDTAHHAIYDSVRGATKQLSSSQTNAETTQSEGLTAFGSDGFTVGNLGRVNEAGGRNYASWNWKANGSGSSNTDGSITSTVSANTTSGFSIVSYTGNATSGATVGHGLGVTPDMLVVKNRDNGSYAFTVYHKSTGNSGAMFWTTTDAFGDYNGAGYLRNPNSSTFETYFTGNGNAINASGDKYIAYCFAEKKGFSKFGSYTGNGSTDGSFTYLGFRPAFIIVKRADSAGSWRMWDSKRNTFNLTNKNLRPNTSDAEATSGNEIDILSNGFKARATNGDSNGSGGSYIYMAFAENPLVGTNNIPATAR